MPRIKIKVIDLGLAIELAINQTPQPEPAKIAALTQLLK